MMNLIQGNLNKDFNQIFSNGIDKIKNAEDASPERKKIRHSYFKYMEPTWLERNIYNQKLNYKKYEFQAKSDQTGVFKKVWIKIKSFVVKIIQLITKALAKVHRFVKNKYYDYKIEKQI